MITQTDLTYTRYQPRQSSLFDQRPDALPDAEPKQRAKKLPSLELDLPAGSLRDQLADLLDRLNKRTPHHHQDVSFELETKKGKYPRILMKDNATDSVLGRYTPADLIDLERSLFDMAGFRLSVEG